MLDLSLPLTQAGAVFLDERRIAGRLSALLDVVGELAEGGRYPATADAIARARHDDVVALALPTDTPPPGRLGLFTDGAQHAAAVAVTASGRRVFIGVAGDAVATNLTAALFDDGD